MWKGCCRAISSLQVSRISTFHRLVVWPGNYQVKGRWWLWYWIMPLALGKARMPCLWLLIRHRYELAAKLLSIIRMQAFRHLQNSYQRKAEVIVSGYWMEVWRVYIFGLRCWNPSVRLAQCTFARLAAPYHMLTTWKSHKQGKRNPWEQKSASVWRAEALEILHTNGQGWCFSY